MYLLDLARFCWTELRYGASRAAGHHGHARACKPLRLIAITGPAGQGLATAWHCSPGCPSRARRRVARAR